MATFIIHIPEETPMVRLFTALAYAGLWVDAKNIGRGEATCYPISPERQGNGSVLKFPRHRGQYMHANLPTPDNEHGPEGLEGA